MSTGYTEGIIDGEIETFEEYAKTCMRAFGATIHMRDDPMSKEWEPVEPSNYYKEKIEDIKTEIFETLQKTEKELKRNKVDALQTSIENSKKRIQEKKETLIRLNMMLNQVKEWEPPTDDHIEFKKFMISQIEKTIDWDTDIDFYIKDIEESKEKLKNIDNLNIKETKIDKLKEDLKYYEQNYNEDVNRCDEKNTWVIELLNTL